MWYFLIETTLTLSVFLGLYHIQCKRNETRGFFYDNFPPLLILIMVLFCVKILLFLYDDRELLKYLPACVWVYCLLYFVAIFKVRINKSIQVILTTIGKL